MSALVDWHSGLIGEDGAIHQWLVSGREKQSTVIVLGLYWYNPKVLEKESSS